MQDQDAPPVEEGETGGGVVVVRAAQTQADHAVAINSTAAFTPRQWTTAIARHWPETTTGGGPGANAQDSLRTIRRQTLTRCRPARMPTPASLALWMISSSRPRSRKPHASSTSKLSL